MEQEKNENSCKKPSVISVFIHEPFLQDEHVWQAFLERGLLIENESCFEFLKNIKDKQVNLILIDPPYEVSRDTNFQNGQATGRDTDRFRISMNFGDWDNNFTGLSDVIKECFRVLKDSGTIICFYDIWKVTSLKQYLEDAGFKQIRFIEWVKTNPVPINSKTNYLTNAREAAVTAVKRGKPTFKSEYDNGIYRFPICHDKDRFHPTQKPVALLEDLIEKHSNENDLVLDCFFGSSSTAVACLHTNRKFIGCEIQKSYFDKSVDRLKKEIEKG